VVSCNELNWNDPDTWIGVLDRSPCGTGTCAVLAVLHDSKIMKQGDKLLHRSVLGTEFEGEIVDVGVLEGNGERRSGIVPQIRGRAYITGCVHAHAHALFAYLFVYVCVCRKSEVIVESDDPLPHYTVADLWGASTHAEPVSGSNV